MNKAVLTKISGVFGVPLNTLEKWKGSRKEYLSLLSGGVTVYESLSEALRGQLSESLGHKEVNTLFGLDSRFGTQEVGLSASTLNSWQDNGRTMLYVGLMLGHVHGKLVDALEGTGVDVESLLVESQASQEDIVYLACNRPSVIKLITPH